MASIFTKIVNGEIPCYKIAEDHEFMAFLDVNPLAKGHTLVIPKEEVDYLFDIDDEKLATMIVFAKRLATGIRTVVPCTKVGMSVVGLEVPHAHIHLIPINSVSDMNFARPKIKLDKEEMIALADAISRVV